MTELSTRNGHSAELAVPNAADNYQSQTVAKLTDWANEARAAGAIAKSLCDTEFVPKHFRGNAASTTAAILTGFEIGLPPMAALRSIYVIGGTPAMYAATMRALLMSQGHEIWVEESTDSRVIMAGRRKDSDIVQRVTWTMDRAKKAELMSNAHYRKNPQNMLTARCSAELCRLIAPDVIHGIPYAVEELDDGDAADVPAAAPAEPKKRTMKRAPAEPPATPEPDLEEPAAADPDAITPQQMRLLQKLLNDAGITEQQAKRDYCTQQLGRVIESVKDLSRADAGKVIDQLTPVLDPEPDFDADGDWPTPAQVPAGGESNG